MDMQYYGNPVVDTIVTAMRPARMPELERLKWLLMAFELLVCVDTVID